MAKDNKNTKGKYSVRLAKAREGVNFDSVYDVAKAIDIVKKSATAKFDESIDIAINLGIDSRQSDQNVRDVVSLPNGTGKTVRVAVIARDDNAKAAKKAGAEVIGAEDLIDDIKAGNINFDKLIATPDMMPLLGQVAKILGPKGLMPNPKLGTITTDVEGAVKSALAGQVEIRAEKGGVVHAIVGKKSFDNKALEENINALVKAVIKAKPSGVKGVYLKRITLSSTMGVGVKVNQAAFAA